MVGVMGEVGVAGVVGEVGIVHAYVRRRALRVDQAVHAYLPIIAQYEASQTACASGHALPASQHQVVTEANSQIPNIRI